MQKSVQPGGWEAPGVGRMVKGRIMGQFAAGAELAGGSASVSSGSRRTFRISARTSEESR